MNAKDVIIENNVIITRNGKEKKEKYYEIIEKNTQIK